jgi:dienelactone hydrolase
MKNIILILCLASAAVGCTTIPESYYPTKDTNYHTNGIPIEEKYIFKEVKNTPRPTVIIAHGCDGTQNQSYKEWLVQVSQWGYNGVMIDSFLPRSFSNLCHRGYAVNPELRAYDIGKLVDYIKKQTWHTGKIAVIGFSHGGSTVLNLANNDRVSGVDAAVAYYPSCYNKYFNFIGRDWSRPQFPVQIHFGDKDTWTPPELCTNIEKYESHMYKNATHAFDMNFPSRVAYGYYMEYNSEADRLSRKRTKEFLDKNLVANK